MPVGYVFVGNPGGHVEHNDTALALDVITISQPTEFFLPGCVPNVEADVTKVGMKVEWVDLNTKSGCLNRSVYDCGVWNGVTKPVAKAPSLWPGWMELITHQCTSFQTRRSYDAVRYHEHVHSEVALGV